MHFVILKDGRFILNKSGIDLQRNHGATCVPKKVPTDRETAFRLYIVDDTHSSSLISPYCMLR